MILFPDGWRSETTIGSVVLASPDQQTQMRYRMRIAPLRRFADVVDEATASLREWNTTQVAPRERLVTHEGEHAFSVALQGDWLGTRARRFIGAVYADDYQNVLDVISLGADAADARAMVLLHGASLQLGVRKRRYFYDRPLGWHGHTTGLVTHWFPAQFPARPSTVIVYPANPTHEEPHAVFEAVVAHQQRIGAELRDVSSPTQIVGRHDLEGLHWRLTCVPGGGPLVHRDLVVFAHRSLTYALQLDSVRASDEDARATFLALARSVEPVPQGGVLAGVSRGSLAFAHYL